LIGKIRICLPAGEKPVVSKGRALNQSMKVKNLTVEMKRKFDRQVSVRQLIKNANKICSVISEMD
jgi:hypothetical protein